MAQKAITAADGKTYMTTVVNSKTIPLWLATIDENRVAEQVGPKPPAKASAANPTRSHDHRSN